MATVRRGGGARISRQRRDVPRPPRARRQRMGHTRARQLPRMAGHGSPRATPRHGDGQGDDRLLLRHDGGRRSHNRPKRRTTERDGRRGGRLRLQPLLHSTAPCESSDKPARRRNRRYGNLPNQPAPRLNSTDGSQRKDSGRTREKQKQCDYKVKA